MFNKRIHPKTRESLTQPWPFEPALLQGPAASAVEEVASGELRESFLGVGVGGVCGRPEHPLGEVEAAGTPVAPWVLPAGLTGDNSSDGEDFEI